MSFQGNKNTVKNVVYNFCTLHYNRGWGEKKCTDKLPFYNYFKPNFRHLHEYLSQN